MITAKCTKSRVFFFKFAFCNLDRYCCAATMAQCNLREIHERSASVQAFGRAQNSLCIWYNFVECVHPGL